MDKEEREFQAKGVLYEGREEWEDHSGTVRSSEISLTFQHTRTANGGRLR